MKYRGRKIAIIIGFAVSLMFLLTTQTWAILHIHYATRNGDLEMVKKYIALGEDVNAIDQQYGHTPLGYAALGGFIDVTKLLLAKGAKIDAKNLYTNTPLHVAAKNGRLEVAELLIKSGADINAQNRVGLTALHFAAGDGNEPIVKLLVDNNAKIDVKDKNGMTPHQLALKKNHQEIAALLEKLTKDK